MPRAPSEKGPPRVGDFGLRSNGMVVRRNIDNADGKVSRSHSAGIVSQRIGEQLYERRTARTEEDNVLTMRRMHS